MCDFVYNSRTPLESIRGHRIMHNHIGGGRVDHATEAMLYDGSLEERSRECAINYLLRTAHHDEVL